MNTRSFRLPVRTMLWTRVLGPATTAWVIGVGLLGWTSTVKAAHVRSGRTPASVVQESYRSVWSDLGDIPASCKPDLPLSAFHDDNCDQLWRGTVARAGLTLLPVLFTFLISAWLRRSQERVYREARLRVERQKQAIDAHGCQESAQEDLFSWLHCLKPAYVLVHDQRVLVYLSHDAPMPGPSDSVVVYDLGRVFGKFRRIAVVQSAIARRI